MNRHFSLSTPHGSLLGHLERPDHPRALVLVASVHNAQADSVIAANLAARGYAILSMELLTTQETHFIDAAQNVPRLTQRLLDILDLIRDDGDTLDLPLAIFASGEVTPAAIRVAARRDLQVRALACHGGLIDRAGLEALQLMSAPLLMLFDAADEVEKAAFRRARPHLRAISEEQILEIGEDASLPIANWLTVHLQAISGNPADARL
jgi:dienelactone hydrolase